MLTPPARAASSWSADKQAETNRDEWIDPEVGKVKLAEYAREVDRCSQRPAHRSKS